jgi:isocitrate dehydrogenase (NAD+)
VAGHREEPVPVTAEGENRRNVDKRGEGRAVMRVVVVPGDGIGPDVVSATQAVLHATGVAFEWDVHKIGSDALSATGSSVPEEALQAIRDATLALKGPVATTAGSSGERSTNVTLRRALGLSVQVRPCRSYDGVRSPFRDVNLVVIRDTIEDLYSGVEFGAGAA